MGGKLFQAVSHFITISNCSKKISQEKVVDRIKSFLPPYKTLSIAAECANEKHLHYHIFVDCKKKWSFAKSRWAPLRRWFGAANEDFKQWHKRIGITKLEWKVEKYRYCNNLVNIGFESAKGDSKGQLWVHNDGLSLETQALADAQELKPDAQILMYFTQGITLTQQYSDADWDRKAYIAKNWDVLLKMITNHKRIQRDIAKATPKYTKENFNVIPEAETLDMQKYSMVIQGPPEMGKTAYAKTLLPNHLRVTHPDKLKQFDENVHDGIIFDDQAYGHWPRESVIHIMDVEEDSDINVKNSMVTIPAGTPRIFITNRPLRAFDDEGNFQKDKSFLPEKLDYSDNAIDRRLRVIQVVSDLRKLEFSG